MLHHQWQLDQLIHFSGGHQEDGKQRYGQKSLQACKYTTFCEPRRQVEAQRILRLRSVRRIPLAAKPNKRKGIEHRVCLDTALALYQ
jgi:hypothetical protein